MIRVLLAIPTTGCFLAVVTLPAGPLLTAAFLAFLGLGCVLVSLSVHDEPSDEVSAEWVRSASARPVIPFVYGEHK